MKPGNPRPLALLLLSAVSWLLFFTLRSLPPEGMRLLHVALFSAWSFCLLAFLGARYGWRPGAVQAYLLLGGIAALCELIQFWTPQHDPQWQGFAASLVGVFVGRESHEWLHRKNSGLRG